MEKGTIAAYMAALRNDPCAYCGGRAILRRNVAEVGR